MTAKPVPQNLRKAAENLREAADHVEKVGLHQGGLYFADPRTTPEAEGKAITDRPCCALGAIAVTLDPDSARGLLNDGDPEKKEDEGLTPGFTAKLHDGPEAQALTVTLNQDDQIGITGWNDYRVKDASEVAATMRKTADRLEANQ